MKTKYKCIYIGTIISKIGIEDPETPGYYECIIESFIPDNTDNWPNKKQTIWIKENNRRMEAICELLNTKNL